MSGRAGIVLTTGLPRLSALLLEARLPGVATVSVEIGEAMAAQRSEAPPDVVLLGPDADYAEAVALARGAGAPVGGERLPVVACLPELADRSLPRRLVEQAGVVALLVHPLDHEELVRVVGRLLSRSILSGPRPTVDAGAALASIWTRHRGRAREQAAALEAYARALAEGRAGPADRNAAEREAHRLAGSLGTFGIVEGSVRARALEEQLAAGEPDPAEFARGAGQLLRLIDAATGEAAARPAAPVGPRLLLVSEDEPLISALAAEARRRSLSVVTASRLPDPAELAEPPDLAVVDLAAGDPVSPGAPWPAPVLLLADAARSTGPPGIERSTPARNIVDLVLRLSPRGVRAGDRVLALDDDPAVLEAMQGLFAPRGIELTMLEDPVQLVELLDDAVADLVILDLDLPSMSGVEVCRMLRAHPRWMRTSILFLTAHGDSETVQRVFRAGADDFVRKPIVGPELLARVGNRLERARLQAELSDADALTGLANRRRSVEALEELARLSDRFDLPMAVAMLDVDHFKQINDVYGHDAGDEVLRALGEHLGGAFRSGDVVGRWGGEEFVVGLFAADRQQGVTLLERVLGAFRDRARARPRPDQRVTLSAGVAEYPRDDADLGEVLRLADLALYRAKTAGRDRVLPVFEAAVA